LLMNSDLNLSGMSDEDSAAMSLAGASPTDILGMGGNQAATGLPGTPGMGIGDQGIPNQPPLPPLPSAPASVPTPPPPAPAPPPAMGQYANRLTGQALTPEEFFNLLTMARQ
jgi:hypothetical protein